jgi:ribosomal protein S18 acetylase RimI-like enzyme
VPGSSAAGSITIRPRAGEELDAAVAMLAAAFHHDPGALIIQPDPALRPRALRILFAPVVRWALPYGHVAAAVTRDGDIAGLATFLPPGHDTPTPAELEAAGFAAADAALPEEATRNGPMVAFLEAQHAAGIEGPHWRLEFFGVDPAFQGTGLGSRLIETGHGKADAAGERVWLETFTAENVRWYEARGYRIVSQTAVPGSPFTLWGMIREPRRSAVDG